MDKDVIRNLFLSYFSAPGDKKAEVAELVASVLGFSPEERRKALGGPASASWLAFLKRSDAGTPDSSLTAQFVRFLEEASAENAPSPAAPALPLHYAQARPGPPPTGTSSRSPSFAAPSFAAGDSSLLASAESTSDFLKSAVLSKPAQK